MTDSASCHNTTCTDVSVHQNCHLHTKIDVNGLILMKLQPDKVWSYDGRFQAKLCQTKAPSIFNCFIYIMHINVDNFIVYYHHLSQGEDMAT